MDDYVLQFVRDTEKKINVKRRLPKFQYEAYEAVIHAPYHLADTEEEALLVLDCISETFRNRWFLYGKQEDANVAAHAQMVASAFRSAETLQTTSNHDILKGKH